MRRFFRRPANGLPITEDHFDFGMLGFGDEEPPPPPEGASHAYRWDQVTNRSEVWTRTELAFWYGASPIKYEPSPPSDEFRATVQKVRIRNR